MGFIVAVANQKGGVGKTTVTLNLAGAYAADDINNRAEGASPVKVLVVDADPQNTSSVSAGVAKDPLPFTVVSVAGREHIGREIKRLAESYDLTIVDCPPEIDRAAEQAIGVADFVLVPLDATPADLWSTKKMLDMVARVVGTDGPRPKAAIVFNKTNQRVSSFGTVSKTLEKISKFPILATVISQREVYRVSMGKGYTVFTVKGQRAAKDAQKEMESVADEILVLMGVKQGVENVQ